MKVAIIADDLTGAGDTGVQMAKHGLSASVLLDVRKMGETASEVVVVDTDSRSGCSSPRIAVCGINPHAGENGLFGNGEEETKLIPAIRRAAEEGIDVSGPYPADTLFYRAVRGDFDIVVACYHDQGHAPVKVLGIEEGVNVTVGLKGGIIRTSVDHGTAFDIAGKNLADERSMIAALKAAAQLAPRRKH